jgi:hypothetical protein
MAMLHVCICFASFEIPKTYQPAKEKNKRIKKKPKKNHADILELYLIIKM